MILVSPWMDATLRNPDIQLNEREDPMMSVERFSNSARAYVGKADPADPAISPMFGDRTGLPPRPDPDGHRGFAFCEIAVNFIKNV